MGLFQLIYTSKRKPNCTDAEIQKILQSCEENNPEKDVTGILLHSDNNFVQYLEGNLKDITFLYDLIKEDPRHKEVVMISLGPIKERLFPKWAMGYKTLNGEELGFHSSITEEERNLFKSMIKGNKTEETNASRVLTKFFEAA